MKKVNLTEIRREVFKDNPDIYAITIKYKELVEKVMKEACRQVLELAAENAEVETCMCQKTGDVWVDKQSILDTLNQVE